MPTFPRILPLGDGGLTVEFGDRIAPEINDLVLSFARTMEQQAFPGLVEVVPTYRSATLYFDPLTTDVAQLAEQALAAARQAQPSPAHRTSTVTIPVLYGGAAGPDLAALAALHNLTPDQVVAFHTSVEYRVYMLGFSPGFPYLGQVPDAIATPRLATPRAKVPAGSVGIAGSQTGIYPIETPGGWRLIGRTPLRLFDPARPDPFFLRAGDRVRFVPIDHDTFGRIASKRT